MDEVWAQILAFYWPIESNYAIEREPYAAEGAGSRADIVLTTNIKRRIFKCLFVECKRDKTLVEDRDWDSSKLQLERYVQRWQQRSPSRPVYGLLCIGHAVRFYVMPPKERRFQDFKSAGLTLSIKDDVAAVDAILRDIRELLAVTYHAN